jgi:hypothetical protein
LHQILRRHTVLPKHTKETRFFDVHFHRGMGWYRKHYPRSGIALHVGEVAPTYFASWEARRRIRELIPSAKIICIFRNPVERIMSLYRVKRAYGLVPWNLEQAVLHDLELIESSRYATHLRAWQQAFGAGVLPTFFDDLRDDPQAYVNILADFIGIPRFTLTLPEFQVMHASETMTHPRSYSRTHRATLVADWLKARHLGHFVAIVKGTPLRKLFLGGGPVFGEPSTETALMIYSIFRREMEELEMLVNRDLSAWRPAVNSTAAKAS